MAKFKNKQLRRSIKKERKKTTEGSKLKRFKHQERGSNITSTKREYNNNKSSKTNPKWKNGPNSSKFSGKKKNNSEGESESESEVEVVPEKELKNNTKSLDSSEDDSDQEFLETQKLVTEQNRKKKKSGGFQSMGLSHSVYTGVIRKGYKVPTPIQRKTIPLIMDGKDLVAMARTGSGKTAAFLIPVFEKLKGHSGKAGARAIIMSPTRELALQTLKFTKELGKFTGLRAAVILGGDRMEDQFSALHNSPDIIIATPGRFLHVLVEMELKLNCVEYVVFDEADRLFEMGFREQLHEIINRLPESRQTVLFSATLPKLLVEFAKAGLHDPVLIRLDVDSKISDQLQISYLQCRADDKSSVLLSLLRNVIRPYEQTVIFVATKHHVEYINMLLTTAGISCSYIYSSLDQTARKIAVAKFQHRKTAVLIVTDLAARGIDIPMLDNVINFNFPAKPKLFVHRVGRVARAGRSGTAYSLVSQDELPFLLDLHLFLGRPLKPVKLDGNSKESDGLFGDVPQSVIDEQSEHIREWTQTSTDLQNMIRVCGNAYKNYIRSRPAPSSESIKRCKQMERDNILLGTHPLFDSMDDNTEAERTQLLTLMKTYKPSTTIFEINSTVKNKAMDVMKKKRNFHQETILSNTKRVIDKQENDLTSGNHGNTSSLEMDSSTRDELEKTFSTVIMPRKVPGGGNSSEKTGTKHRQNLGRDEENFLHYRPSDFQSERGLSLGNNFDQQAEGAVLDLTGDDSNKTSASSKQLRWDRKKKKYVRGDAGHDQKNKKIRTESGALIPASYRSNLYKDWLNKNNMDKADEGSDHEEGRGWGKFTASGTTDRRKRWHTAGGEDSKQTQGGKKMKYPKRSEIQQPEQILKVRRKKAKQRAFEEKRSHSRQKRRNIQTSKAKKGFKR